MLCALKLLVYLILVLVALENWYITELDIQKCLLVWQA